MHLAICSEYFGHSSGATGKVLADLAGELLKQDDALMISVIAGDRSHRSSTTRLGGGSDLPNGRLKVVRLRTTALSRDGHLKRLLGDLGFSSKALWGLLTLRPRPDIVLVVTNPFLLPGVAHAYKLLANVPYVYLVHDLYPDILEAIGVLSGQSLVHKTLRRFQTVWLRSAAHVVTLGRCMLERVRTSYGIREDLVHAITNWSDLSEIVAVSRDTQFRSNHGIDGFLVLYSGNIGRFHDVDTILDAAQLVQSQVPCATFAFVGKGGKRQHIERRIQKEGIANVLVLDFVSEEELPDLLASADLSLVTLAAGASGTAVPLKFYNLLAIGRPVVAVMDEGEVTNVLDENRCGLHVRPGQSRELADIIVAMAGAPDRVCEMGRRAREVAASRFSLSIAARKYRALFSEVYRRSVN